MTDFKIKIMPWWASDEFFVVKVKKKGNWFWEKIQKASQDILTNDWYLSKEVFSADESKKERALNRFSCWQDYLDYKAEQQNIVNKNQKELDTRRKEERKRLNNFYK